MSAFASYDCAQAPAKLGFFWQRPSLPTNQSDHSSRLLGFCSGYTSRSNYTSQSAVPRICYTYKSNGLVIELSNRLFCEGWSKQDLDLIVSRFTFKFANYYQSDFELVLFNKKQRVYRQIVVDKEHEIFDHIDNRNAVERRMKYVVEKISSGDYSYKMAGCLFSDNTTDGEPCPMEIPNANFEAPKNITEKTSSHWQIPNILHVEFE